jgi:hypothetical protein
MIAITLLNPYLRGQLDANGCPFTMFYAKRSNDSVRIRLKSTHLQTRLDIGFLLRVRYIARLPQFRGEQKGFAHYAIVSVLPLHTGNLKLTGSALEVSVHLLSVAAEEGYQLNLASRIRIPEHTFEPGSRTAGSVR